MKEMRTKLLALLICGSCGCVHATDDAQHRLPGYDLALPTVASQCEVAVVATLVSLGQGTPGAPFTSDYRSRWTDITSLWGQPPTTGEFCFHTHLFLPERPEQTPVVGGRYILLSQPHDQTKLAKIILCTPQALREVKTELRNKTKSESNQGPKATGEPTP